MQAPLYHHTIRPGHKVDRDAHGQVRGIGCELAARCARGFGKQCLVEDSPPEREGNCLFGCLRKRGYMGRFQPKHHPCQKFNKKVCPHSVAGVPFVVFSGWPLHDWPWFNAAPRLPNWVPTGQCQVEWSPVCRLGGECFLVIGELRSWRCCPFVSKAGRNPAMQHDEVPWWHEWATGLWRNARGKLGIRALNNHEVGWRPHRQDVKSSLTSFWRQPRIGSVCGDSNQGLRRINSWKNALMSWDGVSSSMFGPAPDVHLPVAFCDWFATVLFQHVIHMCFAYVWFLSLGNPRCVCNMCFVCVFDAVSVYVCAG